MSVEDVLVAILGREEKPVGGGFLTGKDAVLTCAHVVNAALGRSLHATGRPSGEVQVRLPGAPVPVKTVIEPAPDGWEDLPASQVLSLIHISGAVAAPPAAGRGRGAVPPPATGLLGPVRLVAH